MTLSTVCTIGSNNLIWSWWVHPLACREAGTNNLLFAGVTTLGEPRIFRQAPGENYATGESFKLPVTPDPDDHNSVSILSVAGKDLVAFWQRHGKSPYLNYWKLAEGEPLADFEPKLKTTWDADVSYHQVLHLGGGRCVSLVREGAAWSFKITDDWYATTSPSHLFLTGIGGRIYLNMQPSSTPGLYHFSGAQNPASNSGHYLIYGTVDWLSGEVTDGRGNVIGDVYTDSFVHTDFLDISPLAVSIERVRLLDIHEVNGVPVIAYAKWGYSGSSTSLPNPPARYYLAAIGAGGNVAIKPTGIYSGPDFSPTASRRYLAGVCFDRNGTGLYVARRSGATSYLERYDIEADFTLAAVPHVLKTSANPLVRPVSVRDMPGVTLVQELFEYASYITYESRVWVCRTTETPTAP